jgi:hypothetical protein
MKLSIQGEDNMPKDVMDIAHNQGEMVGLLKAQTKILLASNWIDARVKKLKRVV